MQLINWTNSISRLADAARRPSVETSMSFYRDLGIYLRTFKCLGILCVSYQREGNLLRVTRTDELCALLGLCTTQLLSAALLAGYIVYPSKFYPPMHSKTGQIYLVFNFCFGCVVLSMLNLYFYVKRCEHMRLVQQLLDFNRNCLKNCRSTRFSELYLLYVLLALLSWYNHFKGFMHAQMTGYALALNASLLSLSFMICGIVIVFYVCVESVLEGAFDFFNRRLAGLVAAGLHTKKSRRRFKNTLIQRNELLLLCHSQVNHIYGIIILPITAFMLFSAPSGFFYLIAVVFEYSVGNGFQWLALFISVTWNLPLTLVFVIMMAFNGVGSEVEKFLLKNIRPRPILTAYGFFSMDRSALFNLGTAALTYMVILVQFKEMETSTTS